MSQEKRFSCENVRCERSGEVLFSGLGFCLIPGSFLLLKGTNGSGKTSLINILAGLSSPITGKIEWNGEPARNNHDFYHNLTYIGHKNALKDRSSVYANVKFWADIYQTEEMLAPAMYYFGLSELAGEKVHTLSAGWQRRVALCRLLLSPSPLWMLDEPTNFLDEEAVALLSQLIETRVNHGGMVIVASHTMSSAFDAHILKLEDFT